MELRDLRHSLENRAKEIRTLIESVMPSKGDKEEDCQRLTLLNRLGDLENAINGIEEADLKEDETPEEKQDKIDALMEGLLVGALEGGSNDWYVILNDNKAQIGADHITQVPFRQGGFLLIADIEDNDDQVRIDKAKLLEGWEIFKEKYPEHYKDAISEKDDADTADVFFQCACWGEIVFG